MSHATLKARKRGEADGRSGITPKPEDLTAADAVAALRKEWQDRGASFHSWRRYFAIRVADRIFMRTLQIATGHKTEAMAKHYSDHADPAHFAAVAQARARAFREDVGGIPNRHKLIIVVIVVLDLQFAVSVPQKLNEIIPVRYLPLFQYGAFSGEPTWLTHRISCPSH